MSILSKLERLNQTSSTKDRVAAITKYFNQDKNQGSVR